MEKVKLSGLFNRSWSARVAQANRERLAADASAVAREDDSPEAQSSSAIQRLLDEQAWRRSR